MATKKISELEAINAAEDNDVLVIVDTSESTTNKITKGNLLIGAGHTIEMTLNENYQIVLVLKNAAGTALSTQTIDLPNENAVTNLAYNNGILTVTKQSGATSQINLTGLIEGLVTESDFNTFKEALQTTLEAINEKDAEQDEAIAENYKVINKLNEKLENQQKVIDQLPQVEGQGTEITLQDTIEAQFTKFDVEGNSDQETTEGRQLFNVTDYTNITLGNNGSASNAKTSNKITITTGSGSTASGSYITKDNLINYIKDYDSSQTYYVSMDVKTNRSLQLQIGVDTRPNFTVNTTARVLVETLINSNGLVIYSKGNTAGDTIEITNIMISKSNNTEFEKFTFGASPNPSYEQPIYSAGDNENLFDTSLLPITKNGVTISKDSKGNVVLNGTPTITSGYINFIVSSKKQLSAGTYTASFEQKKVGIGSVIVGWGNAYLNLTLDETINKKTATINDNGEAQFNINVRYDVGTLDNFILNPKLEKGNKATPYSPYGMGSINEKIQNKNLINFDKLAWYPIKDDGTIDSSKQGAHTDYIKIVKNNNYIFRNIKFVNGVYYYLSYYDENKVHLRNETTKWVTNQTEINLSDVTYIIISWLYISPNQIKENLNPQFEPGTTATSYVPHEEQNISLTLPEGMKLCKIGDNADYFYKEDGKWYKYEVIKKIVLTGNENWIYYTNVGEPYFFYTPDYTNIIKNKIVDNSIILCNYFQNRGKTYKPSGQGIFVNADSSGKIENGNLSVTTYNWGNDVETFKQFLREKKPEVYFAVKEPTEIEITDETLIAQLEAMQALRTYKNVTHINSEDETPAYLEVAGIYDLNKLVTRTEVLESEV